MPDIFKIGYTMYDPAMRAKELEGTGVPHPFVVEYEILVDDPMKLEQSVHRYLRDVNENKEWFRCDFAKCVAAIHECNSGNVYYEKIWKLEREKELQEARRRYEEEKKILEAKKKQREIAEQKEKEEQDKKNRFEKEIEEYFEEKRNFAFRVWLWLWGGGAAFFAAALDSGIGGIIFFIFIGLFSAIFVFRGILDWYNNKCEDEWRVEFVKNKSEMKISKYNKIANVQVNNVTINPSLKPHFELPASFFECPYCWTISRKPSDLFFQCPNCKREFKIKDGITAIATGYKTAEEKAEDEEKARSEAKKYRQRINGVAVCPGCSQKLRFPQGKELHITCPKCGTEFDT